MHFYKKKKTSRDKAEIITANSKLYPSPYLCSSLEGMLLQVKKVKAWEA